MPRINISLNGINLADFRQIIALVMTLITIVGGVAGLVGAGGSSSGGGGIPSIGSQQVTQQQLIDALNDYRRANNRPELQAMPALNAVAQNWSDTLARPGQPFDHNPHYRDQYPAGASLESENILQNHRGASAQQLIQQWANSPGHRANMLRHGITHVGVGITVRGNTLWAVQNFAKY